ncbi:hypothetical protein QA640_39850 [Bradyrhizobium sp. CB82]|uniref:hypothetical protein n=1 Tax=Bradyrhizobium sp. CB82 TaxID=3039159 RepID=UPI0024B1C1AA|nr:hypothetical protein [Bradyrhizobium sp. CB82]WFU45380.1 hypothetical protein QA640_39850 [Bradyrhizobium sp. CB82]
MMKSRRNSALNGKSDSLPAGERLFVDYAGDGAPVVVDRLTGERRTAQIFVAVLGASSFTYARATWTQRLADWISAHVGAFAAIDGVPALLVPDNTKVAVIKASLYDPQINHTYAEMAAHYGTAICRRGRARPRSSRPSSWSSAGCLATCIIGTSAGLRRSSRNENASSAAPSQNAACSINCRLLKL